MRTEEEYAALLSSRDELQAKLLAEQAAGASFREHWTIGRGRVMTNFGHVPEIVRAVEWIEFEMQKALSSSHGTAFFAEQERHVKALMEIRDNELAQSWVREIAREALNQK